VDKIPSRSAFLALPFWNLAGTGCEWREFAGTKRVRALACEFFLGAPKDFSAFRESFSRKCGGK
jgi:hypothetical protein